MVVLLVNQTPYTSSYGPRYLPQAMGSVTEALSGVSGRVRILLPPQFTRVGKGLKGRFRESSGTSDGWHVGGGVRRL